MADVYPWFPLSHANQKEGTTGLQVFSAVHTTCLCWLLQLLLALHNLRQNSEASNLPVPHLPQKESVTLSFLLTPLTPRLDRVGGEGCVTTVENFTWAGNVYHLHSQSGECGTTDVKHKLQVCRFLKTDSPMCKPWE